MIFQRFLFKRISKMGSSWGLSLFNQISSKVWFKGFTKGLSSRQWILSKTSKAGTFVQIGQKQEKHPRQSGFQLKPPSRGLARTVYTAENLNLHIFFCNDVKFKSFGSKWQIVLRLVPKQKESKLRFKSQLKMLRISQCPWAACKLGLQMNSSQQRFLNKEKGLS